MNKLFTKTATLPKDERNARILRAWNSGALQVDLAAEWDVTTRTIRKIIRNKKRNGADVLAIDGAERQRRAMSVRNLPAGEIDSDLIAHSYDELTTTYRVVGEQRTVMGRTKEETRWFYTLSDDDRRGMEFDRDNGIVTTAQKRIDGKMCLLAKLAPVELRRGRK